jgi:hypothetical protein
MARSAVARGGAQSTDLGHGRGFLLNLAGFVPPAPLQAFLGGWLMPRSPSA